MHCGFFSTKSASSPEQTFCIGYEAINLCFVVMCVESEWFAIWLQMRKIADFPQSVWNSCQISSQCSRFGRDTGEVQHALNFIRTVPQLPDQWHRYKTRFPKTPWEPMTSDQMISVSPIFQLGYVGKGADVFAESLYCLTKTFCELFTWPKLSCGLQDTCPHDLRI